MPIMLSTTPRHTPAIVRPMGTRNGPTFSLMSLSGEYSTWFGSPWYTYARMRRLESSGLVCTGYLSRRLTRFHVLKPIDLTEVALLNETVPCGEFRPNRPNVIDDVQTNRSEDVVESPLGNLSLYSFAISSVHGLLRPRNIFLQESMLGAPAEISRV